MINFHAADAIRWAESYDGPLFHALFCDAPYHLTSITKRYKKVGRADVQKARSNPFRRTATGFMGHEWDGGDLAFKKSTWEAFKRVLYPGAFCLSFAGSRGWHRMAVAIEDAGFIIHPTIFGWAYSSGMPKGHKVKDPRFDGYKYGLQSMKPGLEPIILFQKPYEGKPQNDIISSGAGALNMDGVKIPSEDYVINRYAGLKLFTKGLGAYVTEKTRGRVASNLVLMDPEAAQAMGDASKYFFAVRNGIEQEDPIVYCSKPGRSEKDAGLDDFPFAVVDDEIQRYKNPHPTVKALALTRYLSTLLLPPAAYAPRRLFVPFSGVGSEAIGGMLAGWDEVEGVEITKEYIPIARARADYWAARLEEELARPYQIGLI